MKNLMLIPLMLLLSCTPEKKPIEYGSDMCHYCKMTVVDHQHAAEVVTAKGKVYVFDAIECMVNYIYKEEETKFAFLLVNDFEKPGELLDAANSSFLISKAIPSPMGAYLSAFEHRNRALQTQADKGGEVFDWEGIQQKIVGKVVLSNL